MDVLSHPSDHDSRTVKPCDFRRIVGQYDMSHRNQRLNDGRTSRHQAVIQLTEAGFDKLTDYDIAGGR